LIYNGTIYTQSHDTVANSMVIYKNRIIAVGNNLQYDDDFKSYHKIDLKGKTVIPGLVDAHTHFYFFALSLGRVSLAGLDSLEKCLNKIKKFASGLKKGEWVVGEGYSLDNFKKRIEPNRYMLDKVTGGRPAFIYSKDQHTAWVNSKALKMANITAATRDPMTGGKIVRFADKTPTGIFKENIAYDKIYELIPSPSRKQIDKLYKKALAFAYKNGVTGIHSFDSSEAFTYFSDLAEENALGLRISYYFPVNKLPELHKNKIYYGSGTEFFRLSGVKIFADGSLGSQTALCFNQYIGSKGNYGIEVTSSGELTSYINSASRLGFPCAVHAIGDKAVANVLDAFEKSRKLDFGARHRIEHFQLVRKKDLNRVKRLGVIASMQPSHCPADIKMVHKYWGKRGANAYIFRTIIDKKINLAFGSDAPIEPLKPLEGIAAAVRRALPKSRDVLNPKEKILAKEALYCYTVGSAFASGQEHSRGYLMPGYPADFVILSDDITKIAPSKIYNIEVLATIIDGKIKYCHHALSL